VRILSETMFVQTTLIKLTVVEVCYLIEDSVKIIFVAKLAECRQSELDVFKASHRWKGNFFGELAV
jgi:hypothetical protein